MASQNAYDLKPHILQVMDDGMQLPIKWIAKRLKEAGVETTNYTIRVSLQLLISDKKM